MSDWYSYQAVRLVLVPDAGQICAGAERIYPLGKLPTMMGLQNMCVELVDGIEVTANAANNVDSGASKAKDIRNTGTAKSRSTN